MNIVIFGLSITSSWGNGHATTYRALIRALRKHGHHIVFFEHNQQWYASNRDLAEPEFCDVRLYDDWELVAPSARAELRDADVAMVGSYFPDALVAIEDVLASTAKVKAYYDIDTPITIANLEAGKPEYITRTHIPEFDVYFSFTGGPMLKALESRFGARVAIPLYCSVDPDKYQRTERLAEFSCDLSYMGTYATDRQAKVEELFCAPARALPEQAFLLAGAQYPADADWPPQLRRLVHIEPGRHPQFYSSSRFTLNLARRAMVETGYSPSVRLFEAAACGTAIISDRWPGLKELFVEGEQILLPRNAGEVVDYLTGMDEAEIRKIGRRARERVLTEHSAERRAIEFEHGVERKLTRSRPLAADSAPPSCPATTTRAS